MVLNCRPARSRVLTFLTAMTIIFATGCRGGVYIIPSEVEKLDGYRLGDVRMLETQDLGQIPFHARSLVVYRLVGGGAGKYFFTQIDVIDGEFRGMDRAGREVKFRLSDLEGFYVHNIMRGRGAIKAGIIVGAVLTGVVLFIVLLVVTNSS